MNNTKIMKPIETVNKPKSKSKGPNETVIKLLIVVVMTLLMLIPAYKLEQLVLERKYRSQETVENINSKWGQEQIISGPILSYPISTSVKGDDGIVRTSRVVDNFAPEKLDIKCVLNPEERYYGIYKARVYESQIVLSARIVVPDITKTLLSGATAGAPSIRLGISDLKGVTGEGKFLINGREYAVSGESDGDGGRCLVIVPQGLKAGDTLDCEFNFDLRGSTSLNFVPVGKVTNVAMSGAWQSPGFSGGFSPQYEISEDGFTAHWNVMHFNRPIPSSWLSSRMSIFDNEAFGVNLVDPVDHYQKNSRAVKYALMFIVLTFAVFVFVELGSRANIHPIQYLLAAAALILFYTLLLSLSERITFGLAYIISAGATIGLLAAFFQWILSDKSKTLMLTGVLTTLYLFLYVVLQLEDVALLIGSVVMFAVLAILMFLSRKINRAQPKRPDTMQD